MEELVIKVPAPFAGTQDVGFSTRYPEQALNEPLRDVSFFVEGHPELVARLLPRLESFPAQSRSAGEGYLWTDPIMLSDELLVIAYRDRSAEVTEPAESARRYFANLIQPTVIPFLRDCVRLANLRLADDIAMRLTRDEDVLAEFDLCLAQLLPANGTLTLAA
ncbi:MAG TPA: hypothetical protein VNV65_01640 [Candidatus Solibacter sp.]|jgi:hypothetical protein|nr:hypothetical protein [Candidatus Solibacter sp.]